MEMEDKSPSSLAAQDNPEARLLRGSHCSPALVVHSKDLLVSVAPFSSHVNSLLLYCVFWDHLQNKLIN